jgi:ribonuclease HI
MIKINWDASLDTEKAKMGFGMVARDHSGRVVVALCDERPYLTEPTEPEGAEIMALRNAVDLCRHMRLERVCLEEDASLVVQSL